MGQKSVGMKAYLQQGERYRTPLHPATVDGSWSGSVFKSHSRWTADRESALFFVLNRQEGCLCGRWEPSATCCLQIAVGRSDTGRVPARASVAINASAVCSSSPVNGLAVTPPQPQHEPSATTQCNPQLNSAHCSGRGDQTHALISVCTNSCSLTTPRIKCAVRHPNTLAQTVRVCLC
jgi:hypothetical protein